MECYRFYRIFAGDINELAEAGIATRTARQAGPTARHKRTTEICEIIWDHAKNYWKDNRGLPKDGSSTARAIAGPVNIVLRERGLLRAKPLSEKTIADTSAQGKSFRDWLIRILH
jgi:hypothetical protein